MNKVSPWLWGGVGLMVSLGLLGVTLGLLLPGRTAPSEISSPAGSTVSQTLKKRIETLEEKGRVIPAVSRTKSTERETHRVFVSRPLVYLPKNPEPVQPIDGQQITDDGIQVGWKIKNHFDPEDPTVAGEDTDRDGFNNKEEYEKGTDPHDPASSPAKWVKIKIAQAETNVLSLGLSGKSSNRYTLRLQCSGKKKDVDVGVGDELWLATTSKGLEIFKKESEWKKMQERENYPHAIPILVKSYHEDKGRRMDDKTKTENDYDDSYLELERRDGVNGVFRVMIDERGKSRGVVWGVGDIRLISLVPGEGEMGPYRIGQTFAYSGKNFVVKDASPNKVTLTIQPEGEEVLILPKTP